MGLHTHKLKVEIDTLMQVCIIWLQHEVCMQFKLQCCMLHLCLAVKLASQFSMQLFEYLATHNAET